MHQKNFVIAHFPLLKNILKQIPCLIMSVVKVYNINTRLILAYCKLHYLNLHCFYLIEYCFPKSCIHFTLPNTRIASVFFFCILCRPAQRLDIGV